MIMDVDNIKDIPVEETDYKSLIQSRDVDIEDSKFSLPTDIDYYGDDLTPLLSKKEEGMLEESFLKTQLKETYYIESPPSLQLGYQKDLNIYLLKAKSIINSKKAYELNQYDGDTMSFYLDSVLDNPNGFDLLGRHYDSFNEYIYNRKAVKTDETFGLRFLGVNAPEIIHYITMPIHKDLIKEIKYDSSLWNRYIYDKSIQRDFNTLYKFFVLDGKFHEIVDTNYKLPYKLKEDCYGCLVVQKDDSDALGRTTGVKAKNLLKELLENAKDMRIMIDMQTIQSQSEYVKQDEFFNDFMNYLVHPIEAVHKLWEQYFQENVISSYKGFNCFGMDKYRRFLGTIFIKNEKDIWINATKYLIANCDDRYAVMPAYSQSSQKLINYNFSPDAFKIWTYNKDDIFVADALHSYSKLDDRKKIQKAIYNKDYDELTENTIMLGDSLIMYPPTQIASSNETISNRMPVIRGKGSMTKSTPKSTKYLQMDLIFHGDESINGIPVMQKTPSGQQQVYYMNGLRALIAQFKVCPFLPIENKYINEVLNVEAVTLKNISIQTVPGYPECLKATLVLQEFNYRVYMPEIVSPKLRMENYNMFASTICFPLMRYYYQRMIQKGEYLKTLDLDINEYIKETLGEKTALQPYGIEDSSLDFYMLDHDQLAQKLDIKLQSEKMIISDQINVTEGMKTFMKQYGENVSVIFNQNVESDIRLLMTKITSTDTTAQDFYTGEKPNTFPSFTLNASRLDTSTADFKASDAVNSIVNLLNHKLMFTSMVEVKEEFESGKGFCWDFYLTPKTNLSPYEISDTIRYAYNQLNKTADSSDKALVSKMIEKRCFIIRVSRNDKLNRYELETDSLGFEILKQLGKYDDSQEFVENIKQSIDLENPTSFKFNKVPINKEDVIITGHTVSMQNNYSNMTTQFQEGCAPQFMGGQDMAVQIQLVTRNEGFISLLNQLPTIASQYLKRFRKVLNIFPVRISSTFTDFFGINEVTIESVNVTTVPNYPGLYNASITCISVDRTQRNRESLKKVNDFYNFGKKEGIDIENFFDLKPVLGRAELYPDLELPTLTELEQVGFRFIKYANKVSHRVYPDPDFYFVYGHQLGHEIFRKTLLKLINEEFLSTMDINIKDEFGGSASFKTNPSSKVNINDLVFNKTFQDGLPSAQKFVEERRKKIIDLLNNNDFASTTTTMSESDINDFSDALSYESVNKIAISKKIKSYYNSEIKKDSKMYKTQFEPKIKNAIKIIDKELKASLGLGSANVLGTNYSMILNVTEAEKEKYKESEKRHAHAFLNNNIDSELLKPQSVDEDHMRVTKEIKRFVNDFYFRQDGFMYLITKELGLYESLKANKKDLINLYLSAAISNSAFAPYTQEGESKWKARIGLYNYIEDYNGDIKKIGVPLAEIVDNNSVRIPNDIKDAVDNGNKLGTFAISKYDAETVYRLTNKSVTTEKDLYFLDPYYMNNSDKQEVDDYKRAVLLSPYYGAYAYTRIMLIHLKDLLEKNLFLTVSDVKHSDISRIQSEAEISAFASAFAPLSADSNNSAEELEAKAKEYADTAQKRATALIENSNVSLGKIFDLLLIAEDEKNYFKKCIVNHNYSFYETSFKTSNVEKIKKFRMALVALNLLDGIDEIGKDIYAQQSLTDYMESFYIDAANNPELYLKHSFYDMMKHDKRGRMCRAFPTYYFLLVDEGRELGRWKLHDNFYNMSAITSFEVLDSRKLDTSTCTLKLSNMFKTYTQEDDDTKEGYKYDWKDVISSLYSPYSYALREEHRRKSALNVDSTKLVPGIRVHLRVGYGSDAGELPIIFNGNVAEVNNGEQITILAQGDGRELTNPLLSQIDMEDIQNNDKFIINKWFANWITEGATPKTILTSLLTDTGTMSQNIIRELTNDTFFNHNPYGIVHFGDNNFNKSNGGIFTRGETVQNIYEANISPLLGDEKDDNFKSALVDYYALKSAPKLSGQLYGKSFRDIMHICAGASTDYIASVVPFGMRSSIFFGKPRYYYAYDYDKILDKYNNEYIVEKRKPFQQYHIITSYSDIIGNNIKASDKNINTAAIGTYQTEGWLNRGKVKQVGPLFVDYDIYPEHQKTTIVETGYLSKGSFAGDFIPFADWLTEELSVQDTKTGSSDGGRQIAWRMTANALKNSIKDMYDGQVLIMGDPSIKPYHRIQMMDTYEDISGLFEVETVVHAMNISTGFTTSIYPDCISEVDDRLTKREVFTVNSLVSKAVTPYLTYVGLSRLFNFDVKPLINTSLNMAKAGTSVLDTVVGGLAGMTKQDSFWREISFTNAFSNAAPLTGVSKANSAILNKFTDLKGWNKLKPLSEGLEHANLLRYTQGLSKTTTKLDIEETVNKIMATLVEDTSPTNQTIYKKAISELDNYDKELKQIFKNNPIVRTKRKNLNKIFLEVAKNQKDTKLRSVVYKKHLKDLKFWDNMHPNEKMKAFREMVENILTLPDIDLSDSKILTDLLTQNDNWFKTSILDIDNVVKSVRKSDDLMKASSVVAKKAFGLKTVLSTVSGIIIEEAICYAIAKCVDEFFSRKLRNLQVLQIYPLRKDGKPYVAGLKGSKGLVVGSSSYEDTGLIEGWVSDFFDPNEHGDVFNFVRDIFVGGSKTEQVVNNLIERRDNTDINKINNVLYALSSKELKSNTRYDQELLLDRFNILSLEEVKSLNDKEKEIYHDIVNRTQSEYAVKSIDELNSSKLNRMIPIQETSIMEYDFLDMIHNTTIDKKEIQDITSMITYKGRLIEINGIAVNKGNVSFTDYPLLNETAFSVLKELLEHYSLIANDESRQNKKVASLFKNISSKMIITSALRISDVTTWNSTGSVFTIKTYKLREVENILSNMQKDNMRLNNLIGQEVPLFNYEVNNKGVNSGIIKVSVNPLA